MDAEIDEKKLRALIREETKASIEELRKEVLSVKPGTTDDEIDKAIHAAGADETYDCTGTMADGAPCGYKANVKFDICPKCGAKVGWD